jgi:hypothetical protein
MAVGVRLSQQDGGYTGFCAQGLASRSFSGILGSEFFHEF